MKEFVDAAVQVGILPVIIGFLLFDHSKKMTDIQLQLAKIDNKLDDMSKDIERCKKF